MSFLVSRTFFPLILVVALCSSVAFSQCTHIMNDVCYIDVDSNTSSDTIQCGMSKCVVSCASKQACANKQIICDVSAESCIIRCSETQSCQNTKITATTSQYTAIVVNGGTDAAKQMTVDAPGSNGGELYINVSNSDFYSNTINSQSASAAITVNCNSANACHNNTINGRLVQNSITFLCDGANVDCSDTKLYCADSMSSRCYMHCSSCANTHIFSNHGLLNLNWHCKNVYDSCTDSTVHCIQPEEQKISDLIFDVKQSQWHYTYPHLCDKDGTNNATDYNGDDDGGTTGGAAATTNALDANEDVNEERDNEHEWSWLHADMQSLYTIIGLIFLSLCCVKCIIAYWMYSHHQLEIDLMDKGVQSQLQSSEQTFSNEPSNESDVVAFCAPPHRHFHGDHEQYSVSLRTGDMNVTATLQELDCYLNSNGDDGHNDGATQIGRKCSQSKAYNKRTHVLEKSIANNCSWQFSTPEHIHYVDTNVSNTTNENDAYDVQESLSRLPLPGSWQAKAVQLSYIQDYHDDILVNDGGAQDAYDENNNNNNNDVDHDEEDDVDDGDDTEQSALILNMSDYVARETMSESALMTVHERSRTRPKLSSSGEQWTEPPESDPLRPVSMRAVFNSFRLQSSQTRTLTRTMTEDVTKTYSSLPTSMKVNAGSQSNLLALNIVNIPIASLNGISSMEKNISGESVQSTTDRRGPDHRRSNCSGNIFNIPMSLVVTAPTSTRSFSNGSSVQPLNDHAADRREEERDEDADDNGAVSKTRRLSTTRSLPKRRNKQTMSVPVSVASSQSSLTTDTSVSSDANLSDRGLSNLSINASLQIDTIKEDQLYFDKISEFRHVSGYHE